MHIGRLTAILTALTLASAFVAAAAGLGVSSRQLGAGDAAVTACDTDPDGLVVTYTVAFDVGEGRQEVTHVTVSGFDADCFGGRLSLVLTHNGAAIAQNAGPATVVAPTTGPIEVSPDPPVDQVNGVHVVVVGP